MWCWPLSAPTPLQSILWPIIDPILVTFGQVFNFRDPCFIIVTFCFYELTIFRLNEEHFTCHLPYKHSGTFANHKYEERVSLTPKNQKICNPVLVTLLKMRPRYSQSTRENATPSSSTSPLASYKQVPPTPWAAMLRRLSIYEYLYILYSCMHNKKDK